MNSKETQGVSLDGWTSGDQDCLNAEIKNPVESKDGPADNLVSSEDQIRLEDVYEQTGGFGLYQKILFAAALVISFHTADVTNINVVGGFQDHWCQVAELQNLTHAQQKFISIPYEEKDGEYKQCEVYDMDYSVYTSDDLLNWNRSLDTVNASTRPCEKWVYDKSVFESTIRSRYNLVCGRKWLVSLKSTLFLCGALTGAFLGGILADRFGRRRVLIDALLIKVFFDILSALPTHYAVLALSSYIAGVLCLVVYNAAYVLVIELVPADWRNVVGAGLHLSWAFGFMSWPILALGIHHEVKLQLTMFVPRVLFIVLYWIIDESPRWLLLQGRKDEAEQLLRKIANRNKRPLSDDFDLASVQCEREARNEGLTTLFRNSILRRLIVVQSCYWFCTNLIYYALNLNAGSLSGNVFVNTILLAIMEIIGYLASILLLSWHLTGRRWTSCLSMVIAGVASYISVYFILNDKGLAHTLFSIVAKGFVTISFSATFIYTSELFPSEVRNIAMGTCACIGKISALVAPFVGGPLGDVWAPLPAIVYGTLGVICGLLILLQPETRNIPLFKSIEEVENYWRSKDKKDVKANTDSENHHENCAV